MSKRSKTYSRDFFGWGATKDHAKEPRTIAAHGAAAYIQIQHILWKIGHSKLRDRQLLHQGNIVTVSTCNRLSLVAAAAGKAATIGTIAAKRPL